MADDTGSSSSKRINRMRPSPSLSALLAAASALVPTAQATATDDTNNHVSYRFSDYDEDALPQSRVIGDGERYRVLSQQLDLDTKFGGGAYALKLDATH